VNIEKKYFLKKHGVHKVLNKLNDEYNLICKVNTEKGNMIVYAAYVPPNELHDNLLDGVFERLQIIRSRYTDLTMALFADFNLKRNEFKKRVETRVGKLGFKSHYLKGEGKSDSKS
jgi:hypothetical protein